MPKWVKTIVAVLLLPLCIGAVGTLVRVVRATGGAELFWVAFLGGAACWMVVFLLLPKPMLMYVFGHELTHALWAWLFGGRVKEFKASANGGHVVVSKSNFLIVLAPYFFPLYAALLVAGFAVGHLVFGWTRHIVWFHLLLGAAYAFHITLTVHILKTRQSDLASQGWLFSGVVILLGNLGVLLVGLPLLTGNVTLPMALKWWLHDSDAVVHRLVSWL
ncbi:MAG TPA: hypothetical protein VFT34_10785 [Verrucomicrobiae bacterium]|nr:hypothetical protein [Verrucomicrobiae bacterium]